MSLQRKRRPTDVSVWFRVLAGGKPLLTLISPLFPLQIKHNRTEHRTYHG